MNYPNFNFLVPTRIVCEPGATKKTGELVKGLGGKKILVVSDKGLIKVGITGKAIDSLKEAGLEVFLYDKIVPNPRDKDCEEGYEFAKSNGIDMIVAVGGGSSIDTAKAIGVLMTHGGCIKQWCYSETGGRVHKAITPLVAIPTTAGTGSEVTTCAVVSVGENKACLLHEDMCPKIAILDPENLMGVPQPIMASCGMDALTHAIEGYTCRCANPMTDTFALHAIKLIKENLVKACYNPDIDSCTGMLIGSMLAGVSFGYADVAAVHAAAECFGGKYDTPHGVANSIFLGEITRFNIPANPKKYADIAKAMDINTLGMDDVEVGYALADKIDEMCETVNIPHMKDLPNIDPADFKELAERSESKGATIDNARTIKAEDYHRIFNKVYEK